MNKSKLAQAISNFEIASFTEAERWRDILLMRIEFSAQTGKNEVEITNDYAPMLDRKPKLIAALIAYFKDEGFNVYRPPESGLVILKITW